jgi:hypothetical protein
VDNVRVDSGPAVGFDGVAFSDDFDDASQWVLDGDWTATGVLEDSPANYGGAAVSGATLAAPLDLSEVAKAQVTFDLSYDIYQANTNSAEVLMLEASTDGDLWTEVRGGTGSADPHQARFDLSAFTGHAEVWLRFVLATLGSAEPGVVIDNLEVQTLARHAAGFCSSVSLTQDPPGPHPAGTVLTLQADSVGCDPVKYRFRYREKGAPGWTVLQSFSGDDTAEFDTTGLTPGRYVLRVDARTPGIGPLNSADQLTLVVAETCDGLTLDVDPDVASVVGTSFTTTAQVTGCDPARVRFQYKLEGTSGWTSFLGWSTDLDATLDTSGFPAGSHAIRALAKAEMVSSVQVTTQGSIELLESP